MFKKFSIFILIIFTIFVISCNRVRSQQAETEAAEEKIEEEDRFVS